MRFASYLIILAVFVLLAPQTSAQSPVETDSKPAVVPKPFLEKSILLGAHRGGRQMWPENTLAAYSAAAQRWPDILLEGDIQMSADGHLVFMHDDTLDRTTNGTGPLKDKTLAELKALDAGYNFTLDNGQTYPYRGKGVVIPTLAEVIAAIPNHRFLIEVKGGEGASEAVVKTLREGHAQDRFIFASINPMHMRRIKELAPEIATNFDMTNAMALLKALREGDWDQYQPPCAMLSVSPEIESRFHFTPQEIQKIRAKGILYLVFTINQPEKMKAYLAQGVDCILTDNPGLLADQLSKTQ